MAYNTSSTGSADNNPNAVLASMPTSIACVVEVTNHTKWQLSAPNMFLQSGLVHRPPTSILPGQKGICSFHKEHWSAYGCGGVCVWQVEKEGDTYEIAISPYIPFQHIKGSNSLSVAVMPADTSRGLDGLSLYNHIHGIEEIPGHFFPCKRKSYYKNADIIRYKDDKFGIVIEANFGSAFKAVAVVDIYETDK